MPNKGRTGPDSKLTPELASEICLRLMEGESLRRICASEGMPSKSTVLVWVQRNQDGFGDQYATARSVQAFGWADEILDIADNQTIDPKSRRVMVDTRKWLTSKVLPKLYGDKLALTGGDGGPILHKDASLEDMSTEELAALALALANKAEA